MTNESTNGAQRNLWAPSAFNALIGDMPPVSAMTVMNGQLYKGIEAFNNQWVAFVNRCLKDNLDLSQRCAACSTAEEMRRVYGDWYQHSTEHYLDGIVEMANSSKSLVHDTVTAIQGLAPKSVPTADAR
jgi:hypothetical protein